MKTAHALRALVFFAAAALPAALPAGAEEGIRKTGGGEYMVQVSQLDLSQPGDRQTALRNIRTAAFRMCVSRQTANVLRRSCEKQIVSATIANAAPEVQQALQLALTEH